MVNRYRDMNLEISWRIRLWWKINKKINKKIYIKKCAQCKAEQEPTYHFLQYNHFPWNFTRKWTWATTKKEQRLVSTQRVIERSMLGISFREYVRSDIIQMQSRVKDVITDYRKRKKDELLQRYFYLSIFWFNYLNPNGMQ